MSYFGIPIRNGLPIGLGSVAPLASGGGSPFSPLSLFSGGAPGAWYDPSDLTTLFTDSAGTTPVTAVEQPVGLMLDKSQGLVLGPEVAVNGDFATDTAWTKTTGWTISGGSANFSGSNDRQLTQSTLVSGKNYFYTVTATNVSGGKFCVWDSGTAAFKFFEGWTGTQTFTGIIRSSTNTLAIYASTGSFSIDNISVKELPGNHAFQATSASRPVLSSRYNLLTKTEQFALPASAWGFPSNVTVTDNAVAGPNGTLTISQFVKASTGDCVYRQGPSVVAGSVYSYTGVFYVQKDNDETRFPEFAVFASGTGGDEGKFWQLNTKTGATIIRASLGTPTTNTITVTSSGNFWVVTILLVTALTTQNKVEAIFRPVSGNVWGTYNASASGTIYAGWFGLLPANQSSIPYQRVNTATDYDTTGFLPYLKFDGVDDSLSTNSISFTSTDKMSVFAGVRKLSDAALGMLLETSAISDSNDGTIFVLAPGTVGTHSYAFRSKGTVSQNAQSGLIATAPITNTLTGLGNISGDLATLRLNGAQVAQNTGDQGTGNYGNYPLYIGRRNNASLPFNGQLYSMVIVGKAVTAGELTSTEAYVNQKTGAY